MKQEIKPNTFIIGAQKAATTSLYNWISQHPDVCGPSTLKDYPFFLREDFFNKGVNSLKKEYLESGFVNQKILLQGSVQYMLDARAIKRIFEFDSNAKLICVLRDPVERAISAYKYFSKLNIETLTLSEAIKIEDKRGKESLQKYFDFTYKAHGLYAKQLKAIFNIFPKTSILILLYDDLKEDPEETMVKVFNFLEVDNNFKPNFKILNTTGKVKYQLLQNLFFNKSRVRKFLVDNIVDPILPLHRRTRIRWQFNEWNTKKGKPNKLSNSKMFLKEKQELRDYFYNDIEELEEMLNINLDAWKH
jgi:hypothetical protein